MNVFMLKVCPNCHKEFDSAFMICSMCGTTWVDMPVKKS